LFYGGNKHDLYGADDCGQECDGGLSADIRLNRCHDRIGNGNDNVIAFWGELSWGLYRILFKWDICDINGDGCVWIGLYRMERRLCGFWDKYNMYSNDGCGKECHCRV